MKIKLKTSYATALRTYEVGDVVTVPDSDGMRLVSRDLASVVRTQEVETTDAVVEDREFATKRGPGRPRKYSFARA